MGVTSKMRPMLNIEDGMVIGNVDRNFDETLDRLNYLQMVIRNLKARGDVIVMDVAGIDERLVKEITNYETSTEEMKMDVVLLLVEDSMRLQEACLKNKNNYNKAFESLSKIENLLNVIIKKDNVNNSKALEKLIIEAKSKLNKIKDYMDKMVNEEKKDEKQQDLQRKIRRYSG